MCFMGRSWARCPRWSTSKPSGILLRATREGVTADQSSNAVIRACFSRVQLTWYGTLYGTGIDASACPFDPRGELTNPGVFRLSDKCMCPAATCTRGIAPGVPALLMSELWHGQTVFNSILTLPWYSEVLQWNRTIAYGTTLVLQSS